MPPIQHYYRKPDHLYTIQAHPEYWFYTARSDSRQALLGLRDRGVIIVLFDAKGGFLETQMSATPLLQVLESLGGIEGDTRLRAAVDRLVSHERDRLGLRAAPIRVKRFWLGPAQVGVSDFPDELQAWRDASSTLSDAERAECEDAVKGWEEEDLFVFWWGQSYTMDDTGEVTSS